MAAKVPLYMAGLDGELGCARDVAGPSRARLARRCVDSCVVDGGKGIRKALVDVLGDLAVIQRCQIHKLKLDLPKLVTPTLSQEIAAFRVDCKREGSLKE